MILNRRNFLIGAPAVILIPKLLMPVKPLMPLKVDNPFLGNSYVSIQGYDSSGDWVPWEVTKTVTGDVFANGRWWRQVS